MRTAWFSKIDLMIRVLLVAILLAFLIPVTGEWKPTARLISDAAIFVLFLLNGMRIDRHEIFHGLANLKFLVPLLIFIFGAMTMAGWAAASLAAPWLPAQVAVGLIYLGTLPSTVQSATSYTSLARGTVALSVVAAAIVNITGVFASAPIFAVVAGSEGVALGWEVTLRIGGILILPFVIGQLCQGWTRRWLEDRRGAIVWVDRFVIALAVYVAFSGAVEQDIWSRVDFASWIALGLAIAAILAFGIAGAWGLASALRLPIGDRIAFLFAGSQKSAAIGVPLGAILFPSEQAGFVLLPLILYHLLQLVVAAPLSSRLAARED